MRRKVISRKVAYHGTTMGALSITGITSIRTPFEPLIDGVRHVANTNRYRCKYCAEAGECSLACADEVAETIEQEGPETVAMVIMEPVQNSGGTFTPHPEYHRRVREICDAYGVLQVADEVICGFGRLGEWFGCQRYDFTPDLMTCAKGISSGYVPLSAVIAAGRVREPFWREDAAPFLHGGTYAGHPGACVAGLVNLDIVEREGLVARARALEPVLRELLEPLRAERGVGDVRSAGLAAAVELDARVVEADPAAPMAAVLAARRHGVLTRALRGVALQISPPLVVSEDELVAIVSAVTAGVRAAVATSV
jgi:adenosylmethionine-8-amino-7-oxononanoate aminotransferase